MTARRYTIRIEQGSDYLLSIPVLRGVADEPHDVTGWTARGQIRHCTDSDVLLDLADRLEPDGTTVELAIPAEVSSAWVWRQAVYDIELVDPDGRPTRLIAGHVLVSPEITR